MRARTRGHDGRDAADHSPNKRTGARRAFGATSLLANRVVIVPAPRITNYVLLASDSARLFFALRFAPHTHCDRRALFSLFASPRARAHCSAIGPPSRSLRWPRVALTRGDGRRVATMIIMRLFILNEFGDERVAQFPNRSAIGTGALINLRGTRTERRTGLRRGARARHTNRKQII